MHQVIDVLEYARDECDLMVSNQVTTMTPASYSKGRQANASSGAPDNEYKMRGGPGHAGHMVPAYLVNRGVVPGDVRVVSNVVGREAGRIETAIVHGDEHSAGRPTGAAIGAPIPAGIARLLRGDILQADIDQVRFKDLTCELHGASAHLIESALAGVRTRTHPQYVALKVALAEIRGASSTAPRHAPIRVRSLREVMATKRKKPEEPADEDEE